MFEALQRVRSFAFNAINLAVKPTARGVGSRVGSAFYDAFNPRHEAARKVEMGTGSGPLTGHSHEGVHALDWFGHKAAEEAAVERQRLTDAEIEQKREQMRAKASANIESSRRF